MSTEKEEKKEKKEKKQRKPKSRGRMALTRLIAVLIVILLAAGAYYFGYSIFNGEPLADPDEAETYVITIDDGDGVQGVAEELKEEGIIRSVLIMRIQDRIFDYGLAPGSFEVNSGMTSLQILSWLSDSNHTLADSPVEESEGA